MSNSKIQLYFAPMEGVADAMMRDIVTSIGGIDLCVTEFVRITDQVLPPRVFKRTCPELLAQSKTSNGTPVRIQLLGQHPQILAENAIKALSCGAEGIDLNFGCPAKTVNKHRGGAVLLQYPELIYEIVYSVRSAIGHTADLSAKIRLGYEDTSLTMEIASAIESAGANMLTVHARTKVDGYKPPAYWELLAPIAQQLSIPVVANGEIWSVEDFKRCKEISKCSRFMLGRGLLANPGLAREIKQYITDKKYQKFTWKNVQPLLLDKAERILALEPNKQYFPARTKQWLNYLKINYPQAAQLFNTIRSMRSSSDIIQAIRQHIAECE